MPWILVGTNNVTILQEDECSAVEEEDCVAISSKDDINHLPRYEDSRLISDEALTLPLGKSIGHEDLFRYTNGRFLVNEEHECRKRYVKFDVGRLCEVAGSAGGSYSPIAAIDKMEGGFSKALLMKKADGTELVAKIPCPNAGPALFTTASEVAVLQYINSQTRIPVPKVLAWSCDPSNPVGAEYIIMEKAPGTQLFKVWSEIDGPARLSLIEQLTKLERQLGSIDFPALGHLYLQQSLANESPSIPLGPAVDPSGLYCIGVSCDRSWQNGPTSELLQPDHERGPWPSVFAYGVALANREIRRIVQVLNSSECRINRRTSTEAISALKSTALLMESLKDHPNLGQQSRPTLWHTDLHMGNIFVAGVNSPRIVSLIDWQSIPVFPLFIQARWPEFLKPPEDYATGFVKPALPENFDQLDEADKDLALYKFKQASRTKAYETSTYLNNRHAYHAMNVPEVFQELFLRCGEASKEGVVPLRTCLIEIAQTWSEIGMPGCCPISFSDAEVKANQREFEEYRDWHSVRRFAIEYLDTDEEGWVSPEVDFEKKKEQNRALFELFLEQRANGKKREELLKIWPFAEAL